MLFLNGIVGYQVLDDGTPLSLGLILLSAIALFVGTGYIALDTGFKYTGHFNPSLDLPNNRNIGLYVLYQLAPLVFLAGFFLLETFLVLRVLGEKSPMRQSLSSKTLGSLSMVTDFCTVYLLAAALLFAIGQIFQYIISIHICLSTSHQINGAMFETLFTLLAVIMLFVFWSSITEDDWPMPASSGGYT